MIITCIGILDGREGMPGAEEVIGTVAAETVVGIAGLPCFC